MTRRGNSITLEIRRSRPNLVRQIVADLLAAGRAALWAALAMCLAGGPAQAARPLVLTVTDQFEARELAREYGAFAKLLGRLAGTELELYPVRTRIEAAEAMRRGQVDLVLTGPAEYVVFRRLTQAVPLATLKRPGYCSHIMVLADSPLHSIADLKGQWIALGDLGSTSNHLAPMQIIKDGGLDPRTDVRTVHANNAKDAWNALVQGSVAAMGLGSGTLQKLLSSQPEAMQNRYRMLATGDELPGDVLLAAPTVPDDLQGRLRQAFTKHSAAIKESLLKEPEGRRRYESSVLSSTVDDSDYNSIRRMYLSIGYPGFGEFLGKD